VRVVRGGREEPVRALSTTVEEWSWSRALSTGMRSIQLGNDDHDIQLSGGRSGDAVSLGPFLLTLCYVSSTLQ